MNEALIKLMRPELDAAKNEGKAEGKTSWLKSQKD
ncbi:hypothetical protein SAMN05216349_10831 [Oribacterium sp. KHPX15]|nr:hypothetical protein SAMN05216349_10831 [Oribacterium sp. KHPX15]